MYKLLIVDDEDVIRKGLKAIIQKGGIELSEIYEASNGVEALEIIKQHKPEIVITDIRMPFMDGLDLIDAVHGSGIKEPVFIILSGYDDFNYAKRAIQYGVKEYLLKPVSKEEVIKLLNNIIGQFYDMMKKHEAELLKSIQSREGLEILKERYLNYLISHTDFDEGTALKQLAEVGISFNYDLFKVLALEYKRQDKEGEKDFDDLDRFAIKNVVDEAVSFVTDNFWSFYDMHSNIVILLCDNDHFLMDAKVKKLYTQVESCLNKYLKVETFLGAGSNVQGIVSIKKSYEEAREAAEYKIIKDRGSIMFSKDIPKKDSTLPVLTPYYVNITSDTELCIRSAIASHIDEMFEYINAYEFPVARTRLIYNDFTRYIYNYFSGKGIDFAMVYERGDKKFKDFREFWSIEELKSYIKRCLLRICDIISAYKSMSPERKIIDQIIKYMQENYSKDINLNTIADHFRRSSSYLSVLFKKETGRKFMDYLTSMRIEKAKELLSDNSLRIHDIAAMVGYNNSKHFCTVFKRVVGVSPAQYREESI